VHVFTRAKDFILVKVRHACRGSDRDSYDDQLQAHTSPSFYKHLNLIVQAAREPYDVSFALVHSRPPMNHAF
jgi:hypothetical protein